MAANFAKLPELLRGGKRVAKLVGTWSYGNNHRWPGIPNGYFVIGRRDEHSNYIALSDIETSALQKC